MIKRNERGLIHIPQVPIPILLKQNVITGQDQVLMIVTKSHDQDHVIVTRDQDQSHVIATRGHDHVKEDQDQDHVIVIGDQGQGHTIATRSHDHMKKVQGQGHTIVTGGHDQDHVIVIRDPDQDHMIVKNQLLKIVVIALEDYLTRVLVQDHMIMGGTDEEVNDHILVLENDVIRLFSLHSLV